MSNTTTKIDKTSHNPDMKNWPEAIYGCAGGDSRPVTGVDRCS